MTKCLKQNKKRDSYIFNYLNFTGDDRPSIWIDDEGGGDETDNSRWLEFIGVPRDIWKALSFPFVYVIGWLGIAWRLLIDIDGESGREIRISLNVDLLGFGDGEKRISDRFGEPRDAIVINGDWPELTLINAVKKRQS